MSAARSDIAGLSTARLVQRFSVLATRLGYAWEGAEKLELKPGEPEREAVVAELKAVARELRERAPVKAVRPLYESEVRGVRSFAATLLGSIDPEWAWAALRSAQYDAPTREVIDLMDRAATPPPARPTLQDMDVEALLDRFVDVTTRLYAMRFFDCIAEASHMDIRNRLVGEKGDVLRALKARDALDRLKPLIDHPNPTVRLGAATACLAIDTDRALAVLESFPKDGEYLEQCDERDALAKFRKGKPVIFGVV